MQQEFLVASVGDCFKQGSCFVQATSTLTRFGTYVNQFWGFSLVLARADHLMQAHCLHLEPNCDSF
eukprot:4138456-Amphidinium_carterae.1